jgi:membrane-associated protein
LILAALVAMESLGVPVPGETALITAGVLASNGRLNIVIVIVVASAAAIVGDNLGYLIGRTGGRALLERPGLLEARRKELLRKGEPFFKRHGPKAVFLGRWIAGLRIAAAWLAGIERMRWPVFLRWNALGGIAWATSVGLLAYLLGPSIESLIKTVGLAGIALVALLVAGFLLVKRIRARRRADSHKLRRVRSEPATRGTAMNDATNEPEPAYHLFLDPVEVQVTARALRLLISDEAHAPEIRRVAREVLVSLEAVPEEPQRLTVTLYPEQMKLTYSAVKGLFNDLQRGQAPEREVLRGVLDKLPDEHTMRAIELK